MDLNTWAYVFNVQAGGTDIVLSQLWGELPDECAVQFHDHFDEWKVEEDV